jgi:outer membrane protein TolC
MKTSIVAIQAARESYRSAVLAQDAARARFDVGVGDITSVIQAVTQLSTASNQLAGAIFNYNSSISQLYRYSATWPKAAKKQYVQRIDSLRETASP